MAVLLTQAWPHIGTQESACEKHNYNRYTARRRVAVEAYYFAICICSHFNSDT